MKLVEALNLLKTTGYIVEKSAIKISFKDRLKKAVKERKAVIEYLKDK